MAPTGLRGIPDGCSVDDEGYLIGPDGCPIISATGHRVSAAGVNGVPFGYRLSGNGALASADGKPLTGGDGRPLRGGGLPSLSNHKPVDRNRKFLEDMAQKKKFEREKVVREAAEKAAGPVEVEIGALQSKTFGFGGVMEAGPSSGGRGGSSKVVTKAQKWQQRAS